MVILHFLSLIEGLQEYNSLVLAKVRKIYLLTKNFFNFNCQEIFQVFSNVGSTFVYVAIARRST